MTCQRGLGLFFLTFSVNVFSFNLGDYSILQDLQYVGVIAFSRQNGSLPTRLLPGQGLAREGEKS